MSEFKLRFATDELERAQRQQESARLAWKAARDSSPTEYALDEMEAYCWASNECAEAQRAYDLAVIESQATWHAEWMATHGHPGSEAWAERASSLDVGESPAEMLSPGSAHDSVRLALTTHSRED
jgi:hypothetical protein